MRKKHIFVRIKDLINDVLKDIAAYRKVKRPAAQGIPTGFRALDSFTGGLRPGQLIVVAGRPGMGKSVFVLKIAERVSSGQNLPVAFFSLEMDKQELVRKMLCSYARVGMNEVMSGHLDAAAWSCLIRSAAKLSEVPLFVDDTGAATIEELRSKAKALKKEHGIRLVIVDYFQLIPGANGEEDSFIARSLCALARDMGVPVIVTSVVLRRAEERNDHRPRCVDLGALGVNADLVLLLHREEYYENASDKAGGLAEVIVAKNRQGPAGTVFLKFEKKYMRFEDRDDGQKTGEV